MFRLDNSNFLDRTINYFNPKQGVKRLKNRLYLEKLSAYSGADASRAPTKRWNPSKGDADVDDLPSLDALRARSRDHYRNAPLVRGAIDTMDYNVIGSGLKLQSKIDYKIIGISEDQAREWEELAEFEFRLWAESKDCDAERVNSFYELQNKAFISALLSGDIFATLPYIERNKSYSLAIQLIEADKVSNPDAKSDTTSIAGGVEIDEYGAPTAYHINKVHPGGLSYVNSWVKVPAYGEKSGRKNVLHLFESTRPGQKRGVPTLAPVIENLKQLTDYTNAELMSAVVSGLFTVFVKSETGELPDGIEQDDAPGADYALGAGAIVGLADGEDITTANPGRPNPNYDPFVASIVKQIGAALQVPYELLTKHFSSSYSASRAALLEAWKAFRTRRQWFASNFCQPIYEEFLYEAILTGRIQAPGFLEDEAIRKAYCTADWNGTTPGQLDPVKETQASEMRVKSGFSTRQKESAEMNGTDFAKNVAKAKKENALMIDAGLTVSVENEIEEKPKKEEKKDA